jgi:septum formation protein
MPDLPHRHETNLKDRLVFMTYRQRRRAPRHLARALGLAQNAAERRPRQAPTRLNARLYDEVYAAVKGRLLPSLVFPVSLQSLMTVLPRPALILGSSSPYRRALLERLRIPFEVAVPDIDETPRPGESAAQTALRLAEEKARAIAARHPGALVIGSDQVLTLDGRQLGKPGTHERALAQLQQMRGRTVIFHSALCLLDGRTGQAQIEDIQTEVTFRHTPDAELEAYLHLETPYDVAGSAKAEGLGITLLERVQSDDPTALIGLPLVALTSMLRAVTYPLIQPRA